MENPRTENHQIENEPLFAKGANIALVKRVSGLLSNTPAGTILYGDSEGIRLGSPAYFKNGGETTSVTSIDINQETGRIFVRTETSTYELLDKRFKGLNLDRRLGSIHLPIDSQPARLNNEVVNFAFTAWDRTEQEVHINKPALKEVLLESNGYQIFNMGQKLFLIAKVENIHLPFYISAGGTDGKNKGEWYPFFGYSKKDQWLIKGDVDESTGKMNYGPQIDRITALLNQHLNLPIRHMSLMGKIGRFVDISPSQSGLTEPDQVIFDLNKHLLYEPYTRNQDPAKIVERVTGYLPKQVGVIESSQWMDLITKSIK